MKTLLKIFGVILLLCIALIVAAPFLIPTDTIFNKVSEEVQKTTGRTLTIKGDKTLSVFPALKLELNDVHFANMQTGSRNDMASMQQLAIHIPWFSLFGGEFKLDKFVINEPDILLETDKNGKANWQLFDAVAEQPTEQTEPGEAIKLPASFDIELGEVAIYGGTFTYLDGQTGAKQQISDLELAILLPSLRKTLEVKGGITYMQERFELDLKLDTPAKAIEGQAFNVSQNLDSRLVELTFNGSIAKQGQDIKGQLALNGESVKNIAKWQGVDLNAKDNAFNAFSVNGKMHLLGEKFNLEELTATLDELQIKGKSEISLGNRLAINANVDLGMLDLNPYLPDAVAKKEQPTEDDSKPAEPIVWDDTQIDLSALNALDANVVIRSSGLKVNDIELGANQFTVALKNSVAKLSLDSFSAYEGAGKGVITIDAQIVPYKIATNFNLTDIDAQPLLTDATGFDKLLGKGSLNWNLSTVGQSQKSFISALNGQLGFKFADGAVKGANVAEMVRKGKEIISGNFGAASEGLDTGFEEAEQTDFSALTGSFNFINGVGKNKDLSLISPLIRISGEGDVDLPLTKVDYRLVTGIVDSIEGQGTTDDSTGFKIPLRIKGPFHDVGINLDVSNALKDEAKKKLDDAKEKAKEKAKDKVKDKLKGLFG
ncbi:MULTISPECIES: AsmA family protein [unclassified Pseudoalteromonas]|uniref:AsmA family protein n=1 Tax=unclassified Pseudoalteromonas TaxID=194690 RepID=UPI00110A003C|nr:MULTISPECIES: AsmA family protein [unclassified Pseudoalteromonas]TMN78456.1 AsmA family protein [Pseudoalteromonas sp. S410]TMN87665.1 AsmA family protein [Pseudoalteromonas sp. S408]TMN96285.1 AsmA family protein [Pseudoalteromonas sp. S407]TMN97187.1 AsmA family protein [Pseudoalteromonas sp. S409]TMO07252.1 AsmA family protein [Pseudoalteromonas sp. S186]